MIKKVTSLSVAAATLLTSVALGSIVPAASADEVETRKTPIMGWASWNAYHADINESIILSQAQKIKEYGLDKLGYTYVNVDDGWQYGRADDGLITIHPTRFPNGMKYVADELHSMGLKAGIYTDAGKLTCGYQAERQYENDDVGLYGHDREDLERYFSEWGYDFIKIDWCGGQALGLSQETRYTEIGQIINELETTLGRDIVYNICCWRFPGEWAVDVADSWRTGSDITNNFTSILKQLDNVKNLADYCGPGHYNDLDMLQIGNGMSYEEDKSHFAMWCMVSSPLLLGMDLNGISEETLSIISNEELIAIDQDPACIQATVVNTYVGGSVEAWARDLGSKNSGTKAIALLNRSDEEQTIVVSFEELGLKNVSSIRDLWSHTDIPANEQMSITIPAHGTAVLKVSGENVEVKGNSDEFVKVDDVTATTECKVEARPRAISFDDIGNSDWCYYTTSGVEKKRNSTGEISVYTSALAGDYTNAATRYSWSDGTNKKKYATSEGRTVPAEENGYAIVSTPCDEKQRTLTVCVGSYSCDFKIEFMIGGKVVKEETVKGQNGVKVSKLVTFSYHSEQPTNAYVKWTALDTYGTNVGLDLEGIGLNVESAVDISTPTVSYGKETYSVNIKAAATEGATGSIICAFKDTNGKLVHFTSLDVVEGYHAYNVEYKDSSLYAGTLYAYYWDSTNNSVSPYKSVDFNYTSVRSSGIGSMKAKELKDAGAIFLDVRTPEEYNKEHIDGAINLDYTKVMTEASTVLPDKNAVIVVYCSAAKRSVQAVAELIDQGYTQVYNLGSMQNFYEEPTITFSKDVCSVVTAGETPSAVYTANRFDNPEIYFSYGKDSTFADAVPEADFKIPECSDYYITLKAYLVYNGKSYAETEKQFIYWSDSTVISFASDMDWIDSSVGWGTIKRDKSIDGGKLKLAGKTFAKGIGTHATSDIVIAIPEGANKFVSVAGVDDEVKGAGSVIYSVYIDGVLVGETSWMPGYQYFVFDIDIPEGAKEIRLRAFEGSSISGNDSDHADWAVAAFCKAEK